MSKIQEFKILPTGNVTSREITKFKFYNFLDQQLNWKKKHELCKQTLQIKSPLL